MMMVRSTMMVGAVALIALVFVGIANAHSWLGCADYRGDINYYDDSKCYAYPRNWETARAGALTPDSMGYFLGADTGYNYQATETATCQLPLASPVTNAYTTSYPRAIYEQGETYCLAWPMKNHAAATCTNQYIPDTSMKLYRSSANPTSDPTQTQFKENPVTENFGVHTNGVIDCLGFQRSPKFCENTDRALGTGCFTIPADLPVGDYIYQWYWIFNQGTQPYTTCWDAQVVAAGTGRGGGGLLNTVSFTDNLGAGGSTCQTNWAAQTTSVPVTTPTEATSTGTSSTPETPTTPVVVPINGDSIRVLEYPATMPLSGSFGVKIQYAATGERVIVVDVLYFGESSTNWYGKGTATVSSADNSTTEVTVTINTEQTYGAPTAGTAYTLRAWLVAKTVFDAYELEIQKPVAQQNTILAQPWTQEMARSDVATVGAGSSVAASTGSTTSTTSTGAGSSTPDSSSGVSSTSSGSSDYSSTGAIDLSDSGSFVNGTLSDSATSSRSSVSVSGLIVSMALAVILAF